MTKEQAYEDIERFKINIKSFEQMIDERKKYIKILEERNNDGSRRNNNAYSGKPEN